MPTLDFEKLRSFCTQLLSRCPNLTSISFFDSNQLNKIPPELFTLSRNLEVLNLENSKVVYRCDEDLFRLVREFPRLRDFGIPDWTSDDVLRDRHKKLNRLLNLNSVRSRMSHAGQQSTTIPTSLWQFIFSKPRRAFHGDMTKLHCGFQYRSYHESDAVYFLLREFAAAEGVITSPQREGERERERERTL